jgi:hypothetical protein
MVVDNGDPRHAPSLACSVGPTRSIYPASHGGRARTSAKGRHVRPTRAPSLAVASRDARPDSAFAALAICATGQRCLCQWHVNGWQPHPRPSQASRRQPRRRARRRPVADLLPTVAKHGVTSVGGSTIAFSPAASDGSASRVHASAALTIAFSLAASDGSASRDWKSARCADQQTAKSLDSRPI